MAHQWGTSLYVPSDRIAYIQIKGQVHANTFWREHPLTHPHPHPSTPTPTPESRLQFLTTHQGVLGRAWSCLPGLRHTIPPDLGGT
eukprot:1159442-Pelagomonas_calceolata.AAC.7